MNRFKIQAFVREFPFLPHILPVEKLWPDISSIHISRVGGDILNLTPEWDHASGHLVNYYYGQRIHFALGRGPVFSVLSLPYALIGGIPKGKGILCLDAVRQNSASELHDQHDGKSSSPGETTLEAIDRLKLERALRWIVREDYREKEGDRSYLFTIYKPSKEQSLEESLNLARKRAAREVQAEVDF